MSVCIVDDNDLALLQLGRLVQTAVGEPARAFRDPIEALEACSKQPPEVLLVDFHMPQLTGIEVLQKVRSDPRMARTATAVVSGWDVESLRQRAAGVGAWEVIGKPLVPQSTIETVRRLVHESRARALALQRPWGAQVVGVATHFMPDAEGPAETVAAVRKLVRSMQAVRNPGPRHDRMRAVMMAWILADRLGHDEASRHQLADALRMMDLVPPWGAQAMRPSVLRGESALATWAALKRIGHPGLARNAYLCLCMDENWDGAGGPLGLRGEQIPALSRIGAVALALHEWTLATTPLESDLAFPAAMDALVAQAGTRFDPAVVDMAARCHAQLGSLRTPAPPAAVAA